MSSQEYPESLEASPRSRGVLISLQGLSKGGCVFLETFVIATKHSRAEKVTVEAPLCGPGPREDAKRVTREADGRDFEVVAVEGRLRGRRASPASVVAA